jgi:hypothetical protein
MLSDIADTPSRSTGSMCDDEFLGKSWEPVHDAPPLRPSMGTQRCTYSLEDPAVFCHARDTLLASAQAVFPAIRIAFAFIDSRFGRF